jgi:D-3-phosphoglycerate dehydrogenase
VNEILGDHNVDKQMTDSRGDVCCDLPASTFETDRADQIFQVAYLMADVSDVDTNNIKDLHEKLESLGCESSSARRLTFALSNGYLEMLTYLHQLVS